MLQTEPLPVTNTLLLLASVLQPTTPSNLVNTAPPSLIVRRLFDTLLPMCRVWVLQTEPLPVTMTLLLLAPGLIATGVPPTWLGYSVATTAPPLLMMRLFPSA